VRAAGFEAARIIHKHTDLYHDVPDPSSALSFGTQGVTFGACRPG
jgi:hypothetical protein